jgi:hypothetical protein
MKNDIRFGCAYIKRETLREISTDSRILQRILKKYCGTARIGFFCKHGKVKGCCEYGTERRGSIGGGELLRYVSDYQFFLYSIETVL